MAAQLSPFLPDRPPMFNEKHYPHLELKHLPRLPIAPLKESLEKYLRAVQPILSEEEYAKTKKCVEEFARKEGPELYSMLTAFREHSYTSWLEGWWDSMYLEYRETLPINMNPFFALEDDPKHKSQTSRAANLIFATLQFYRQIIENNIELDKDKDKELCMTQYGRLFATTRIPHASRDELMSYINSKHIVVISNSIFYSFDVLDPNNSILPPSNIEANLSFILNDSSQSSSIPPIGILTTEDRSIWSDARSAILDIDKEYNSKRNSSIIQTIDSALFIVCLDKEPADFSDPDRLSHALLHSDGSNRWFDKSIQLIVCSNGSSGINMEHSGIDGHTVLRYAAEITKTSKTKQVNKAVENEVTDSSSRYFASVVSKLEWNIPQSPSGNKILHFLENAKSKYNKFTESTSLKVLEFKKYGRNYIISKKLSPDGFVQMAFQLAYYISFNSFGSTYESAQTRQFYHGRTECIRSQTPESVLMAKLFSSKDGTVTSLQKYEALKKAVEAHGKIAANCVNGKGIDRLLTGLYWMARYRQQALGGHVYKIPSIYLDKGYKELKTDMMSTSNCGNPAIKLFGFGAVVPNGLGLGYIIKPDAINVVVSSFTGKAEFYANNLEKAFSMFRNVLDSIQVAPHSNL